MPTGQTGGRMPDRYIMLSAKRGHKHLSVGHLRPDYLTISGFTSLNGLICLHSVLDKAGSQSVFKRT